MQKQMIFGVPSNTVPHNPIPDLNKQRKLGPISGLMRWPTN